MGVKRECGTQAITIQNINFFGQNGRHFVPFANYFEQDGDHFVKTIQIQNRLLPFEYRTT